MGRNTKIGRKKDTQGSLVASWVKAGLITGALLIVIIVANSLVSEASLICYPIQFIAFLGNGVLAAYFEQGDFQKKKRISAQTKNYHKPNYMAVGAGAGFVVSIIATVVYLIIWSQLSGLLPPGLDLLVNSPLSLMAIDSIAAIGLGTLGGLVGGRIV